MRQSCNRRPTRGLAVVAALAISATAALADMLPEPEGEVILSASGNVHVTNAEGKAEFDLEMLETLPATEFTTSTIWTEGPHTYTGVELKTFLEAIGAEGTVVDATAINDYSVEIPMSDAIEGGPILAYKSDGAYMSRREKGPIWLIYPYDSGAEYRSETVYSRSIWQLDRLAVR